MCRSYNFKRIFSKQLFQVRAIACLFVSCQIDLDSSGILFKMYSYCVQNVFVSYFKIAKAILKTLDFTSLDQKLPLTLERRSGTKAKIERMNTTLTEKRGLETDFSTPSFYVKYNFLCSINCLPSGLGDRNCFK